MCIHLTYKSLVLDNNILICFLKDKRLVRADIPGQVEDHSKKRDFTITHHHHTKLFLPAHLVRRDHSHDVNSKKADILPKNVAGESNLLLQQKNSGKPTKLEINADSQKDIDTKTLREFQKAGINPGRVTVIKQKMALQQYEEEQKKKSKNKEKIDQQKRIKKSIDELKMEDWSDLDVSVLDIEKQKKILEEATQEKRLQQEREKRLQQEAAQQKSLQEEEEWRLQEADRQKRLKEKRLQEAEAAQQKFAHQNNKTCKDYVASKHKDDDNDSESEKYYDAPDTMPDKYQQISSPVDVPNNCNDIVYIEDHFANKPHDNVVSVQPHSKKGHIPLQLEKEKKHSIQTLPDPQPFDDNPDNLGVNDLIQFGNPPLYGVIKWIGNMPPANCMMAGVELVSCEYTQVCTAYKVCILIH